MKKTDTKTAVINKLKLGNALHASIKKNYSLLSRNMHSVFLCTGEIFQQRGLRADWRGQNRKNDQMSGMKYVVERINSH